MRTVLWVPGGWTFLLNLTAAFSRQTVARCSLRCLTTPTLDIHCLQTSRLLPCRTGRWFGIFGMADGRRYADGSGYSPALSKRWRAVCNDNFCLLPHPPV